MGRDNKCPRCGSLMVTPNYDDEPMYCMVCGAQGDMRPTNNVHANSKERTSSYAHTARYSAKEGHRKGELKHKTVRYRLAYANRNTPLPALVMECPWCGAVSRSNIWSSPRRRYGQVTNEREMYVECPSHHTYSMVCDADGEYYWR